MAWWVKNLVESLLWLGLLLWLWFNPWPRNFCMLEGMVKKKKAIIKPSSFLSYSVHLLSKGAEYSGSLGLYSANKHKHDWVCPG